jgi:tetratricopeptide (TPR) repeat protein
MAIPMKPNLLASLQAAIEHHHAGRLDEAEQLYRVVLHADGRNADALNLLGVLQYQRGENPEALEGLSKAIQVSPQTAIFHNNLGLVLVALDRHDEAAQRFEQAGRLDARLRDAFHNLGVARQKLGQVDQAIAAYLKALSLAEEPGTLSGLGEAYAIKGARCEEAMRCFDRAQELLRRALKLRTDDSEALKSLGHLLLATGRAEEAVLAYDRTIQLRWDDPDAYFYRAQARLVLGDFAGGWDDYEYRWRWKEFPSRRPSFVQPAWTGDELKGRTLLVYHEQGNGDIIQFARYLHLLAERGAKMVFAGPVELKPLLGDLNGVCQVLVPNQPLPSFDVYAALMSLPRLCGTRLDNIPASVPYLPLPPVERFPLPPATPGRLRVGLVWEGGTRTPKERLRSIPLKEFLPLLQTADCDFFSLQVGPRAADLAALPAGIPVADIGSRVRDFADTAAVMRQLDVIISVDTAALHLAGALARPAWGLLPYAPDWRWLLQREDTPWYPTLRLFRQVALGDWAGVINRLREELSRVGRLHRELGAAPQLEWFQPSLRSSASAAETARAIFG